MTVTILRRTLPQEVADLTEIAEHALASAEAMGAKPRALHSAGARRDLFVIADWPTDAAAQAYVAQFAAEDRTLSLSDDGGELRSAAGDMHLITLAVVPRRAGQDQ